MDKMDKNGMDLGKANIERLKEIFPECVADGKVNFDALRVALGDDIDTSKEKYSFNWVGKANAMKIALTPSAGTLIPCKEKSKDWDKTENLYIEGDNLEVLKILEKTYHNKIKMIYIDPPYNTGKDFVYHDDFHDNIQNYLDNSSQSYRTNPETAGRFHTDWLNMMYPRLKIARELLTDDGVIFISIDDNEQSNLKKMCDEIFGEYNFVASYLKQSKVGGGSDSRFVVKEHEYCIIYAKNIDITDEMFVEHNQEYLNRYKEKDDTGRYFWDTFARPGLKNPIHYDIVAPDGTVMNYGWIHSKERFDEELKEGKVRIIPKNGGGWSVQFKQYLNLSGKKPRSMTMDFGGSIEGKNDIACLFENEKLFSYPKSVKFIKTLLETISGQDFYVLDFFSGSATTAHAVMKLNAQDAIKHVKAEGHSASYDDACAGKRKFIMVQLPETCDEKSEAYKAGYKNICEIGEERIRRASEKLKEHILEVGVDEGITSQTEPTLLDVDSKGSQKQIPFYLYEGIDNSKEINQKIVDSLDLGFKVFKLDSTNIKPWDATVQYDEQTIFELNDDVIKDGRRDIDVVYEIMLKYGVFNMPLKQETINGKSVYSVGGGYMLISLNDEITTDDVLEIAKCKPKAVVFKESGFVDDNAKINADYTLKRLGVDNVKCI